MFGFKPGHRIIELDETDSTNSFAARLLHDKFPEEGTVIFTKFQKSGRGQRGSSWESERGKNLLISYILFPNFIDIKDQFVLNQAVALSIRDCISQFTNADIAIKWPNDILADGHKIGGVLIENAIRNNKIIHAIIGMGININQDQFQEYKPPATSLYLLEKKTFNLSNILASLNEFIDKWYNHLRLGNFAFIKQEYLDSLFRFQINSNYESDGVSFVGKITGITEDGSLQIEKDDQTLVSYRTKEVKFLF